MEEYRVKKVNEIKQTSITVHVPGSKKYYKQGAAFSSARKKERVRFRACSFLMIRDIFWTVCKSLE